MLKSNAKKPVEYGFAQSCSFYMIAVVVTLVCQGVAAVVPAALAKTYPDIASSGEFNTAFMIVFQLANLAFIVLYTRLKNHRLNFSYLKRGDEGVKPSHIIVPVVASAALMAAMFLPVTWYGYFTTAIGIPEDAGMIENTVGSVTMVVIASVFLAPICEETIYRGVLLHGLRSEYSAVKAALLSSLAFMLMHMSPLQVVLQFALGALSAAIALKSDRLLPSIILHACSNALALVIQFTPLYGVLDSCVVWLTQNVAAAFFITLGLFAGGGALLFTLVAFGFDGGAKKLFSRLFRRDKGEAQKSSEVAEQGADAVPTAQAEQTDGAAVGGELVNAERERIMNDARKKSGVFSYIVGITICVVMFVVNLVSLIVL